MGVCVCIYFYLYITYLMYTLYIIVPLSPKYPFGIRVYTHVYLYYEEKKIQMTLKCIKVFVSK